MSATQQSHLSNILCAQPIPVYKDISGQPVFSALWPPTCQEEQWDGKIVTGFLLTKSLKTFVISDFLILKKLIRHFTFIFSITNVPAGMRVTG